MRVVDVTQWFSPTSGGIRTYLRAKAEWAGRLGLPHAAVLTGPAAGDDTLGASQVVLVRGRTLTDRWGYRIALRPGPVLAALDRLRPDVVVLHDALAFPRAVGRWARTRGVGVAMFCHSDLTLGAAGLPAGLHRPAGAALGVVQRRALAAPEAVVVASEDSRSRVAPHTSARVVTSRLGVDLRVFRAARADPAMRARLARPDEALLLSAGRLSSDKRVDLLVEALALLTRPAALALAGSGAGERGLRRTARRRGVDDRLRFLGYVASRERLATLMATADCFVHPNPAEPFGLAPLEALASGCRVVAADAAGPGETLAGRGAVLVAPGDPAALAAGIERALTLPPPRPRLDDLAWERTFEAEWALYRTLTPGAASRAARAPSAAARERVTPEPR